MMEKELLQAYKKITAVCVQYIGSSSIVRKYIKSILNY